MSSSEHCKLCDNKVMDIITGVVCSKTGKPPSFYRTCDIILFKDNMESKILEVNVEFKLVEQTKLDTFFHVLFYSILSLVAIMVGGYLIDKYAVEMFNSLYRRDAYNLVAIFVVFFSGFLILPIAIGPYNKYRRDYIMSKTNKEKVDKVLKLYGWSYKIKLDIGKEIHGDRRINYDLKMFRVQPER